MEEIVCPKCHSNQITANAKGFNNTTAALGMMTGNSMQGLALGMLGSNKIVITCLKCGNKFKAGDGSVKTTSDNGVEHVEKQVFVDKEKIAGRRIAIVLLILLGIIIVAIMAFFNSLKPTEPTSNNQVKPNAVVVSTNGANLRQSPSITSNVICKIANSGRIFIVDSLANPDVVNGQNGNWYKVKTENGSEGFIWSTAVKHDN